MKGPLAARAAFAARTALAGLGCALSCAWPAGEAFAQSDPRRAVDAYEPSERGSDWFANESLDLSGHLRPSLGYVLAVAHRSYVVPGTAGASDRAPVEDLTIVHLGGSVVLFDRLRAALDLPLQLYAGGKVATEGGLEVAAPPKEEGAGDLRLGLDVRMLGEPHRAVTAAVGVQLWFPTGQKSQWMSDGVFRARPRAMVSGELGALVWAAQLGVEARERSELDGSAAAGLRIARQVVVGPELFASTSFTDAFGKRATPIEALLGLHWLVDGTARLGAGVGRGLGDGIGAPAWRALFAIEWSPEIPVERRHHRPGGADGQRKRAQPDTDGDRIPDPIDACPTVLGVATDDPKTNGCPPDTDGDGIDDLADACPLLKGLATSDPLTNGCPDRDRDGDGVPNDADACPDDRGPPDIDPRRSGCPKAFVHGDHIELLDPVEWKSGTAELADGPRAPDNEAVLTAVLGVLLKLPETRRLRIEGFTDDRGDAAANRRLSAARAALVAKWLVEHGIDRARVSSEGFGGERPVATNETEAGRAENRRLELRLEP